MIVSLNRAHTQPGRGTMGIDPVTAGLITTVGLPFLTSIFAPKPSAAPAHAAGPSPELLAFMRQQQAKEQSDREMKNLLLMLGAGLVAILALVLVIRK